MKANELMIGDWVKFTSKYGYGIGQVVGIEPREGSAEPTTFTICKKDKEGNIKFFVGVSKNCVEPIPFTPEILEKNGFARDEIVGWRFRQYEDGLGLIYEIYWNNKGDELEIVSNLAKIGGFDKKGIQFVHQLQHAIRLCGIEKEIVL